MKVMIQNLDAALPFSSDIEDADGEMIRVLVPAGQTVGVSNIDPYYLNQDKILRNSVFRDVQLAVWFEGEPDDLIGLPQGFYGDNLTAARVGTLGNITLSGVQTIDGVALSVGDRVLVKNQAAPETHGVYTVATGPWPRADDLATTAQARPNLFLWISQGSQADSAYVLTTDAPIVLGSTALNWEIFADAGVLPAGDAINVGAGGVGVVAVPSKIGTNLRFRSINAASSKVNITLDGPNEEVDIDVNPSAPGLATVERRLIATADPRVFLTPETFVHVVGADPVAPSESIDVFHNGARQMQTLTRDPRDGAYYVDESGGVGTGFDTVHFLAFTPKPSSRLRTQYRVDV